MRGFEVVSAFKDKGVILPTRGTVGSAGYDIRVLTPNEKRVEIPPHESRMFNTGIKAFMQEDEVLQLYVRSSVGIKKRLVLSNGTGIIDSTYYNNPTNEGHILIVLYNLSNVPQVIEHNERVAQGIFMKYYITRDDNVVAQRIGGIGSTNEERIAA